MDVEKWKPDEYSPNREELWDRFVAGEEKYFKGVLSGYYKSMYGYGIKLCQQPELVKDCIQELFRSIWERKDDLGHISSPQVYLFVSLRRKVLKKVKRQRKTEGLESVKEVPSIQFYKEEILIKDEEQFQQRENLKYALNQLPNRQKEVIYLHYYSGMSYGEIEQILSINRQSIRNHVYRAMESLRALLDNEVMRLVKVLLIGFLFY